VQDRRTRRRTSPVEDIDWKQVGHRIRELRGLYMTQEEFASRVGVSQSFLSTVEHGKVEVGAATLLRISQEFGRSIEWLLTGKEFVPDR
jgi:transcriptional regulator with XRE-family HTH domain